MEKESPSVNKDVEHPTTLKSILNSPIKRSTTKKTHERKKRLANLSNNPSRSEMTMIDLIYWNPSSSPMKIVKPRTIPVENLLTPDENTEPPPPTEESEDEGNLNTPVPRVIINENGEIIVDESSLVVRRKNTIDTSIDAIVENDNTTYASFRKRSAKQWTTKETGKFYKALSLVGTDFALMENIFTVDGKVTRIRRELKLKFKREEKLNTDLVHRAMYDTQKYDVSILEDDPDDDVLECPDVDDAPTGKRKDDTQKYDVSILEDDPHDDVLECPDVDDAPTGKRKVLTTEILEPESINVCTEILDAPTSTIGKSATSSTVPPSLDCALTTEILEPESINVCTGIPDAPTSTPTGKCATSSTVQPSLDCAISCLTTESIPIGNLLKLPYSNQCNSASEENLLTDAVISEVVTSDKVNRRVRRKAAPNLPNAAKRQRLEPQTRSRPLNYPSFASFTPTEEQNDVKTYSRDT